MEPHSENNLNLENNPIVLTEDQKLLREQTKDDDNQQNPKQNNQSLTLHQIRDIMRQFVSEREWHHFHTPRNLVLALVGQVGQVSELFQWKGEVKEGLPEFTQKQKIHVGQQLSDVLSYLIRLSDVCGVDLSKAFQDKVQKNRKKYPKELVKGSSKKYNEYKQDAKQKKKEQ